MTACGTDLCMCVSEAHFDAGFSYWAAQHGLGFDFDEAWRVSGPLYWTGAPDDVLLEHDWRLASGNVMPIDMRRRQLAIRDLQVSRVKQFYAAYMCGLPPGCARASSLICACDFEPVEEDDEL